MIVLVYLVSLVKANLGSRFNLTDEMKNEVTEQLHKGTPNLLLSLGDELKEKLSKPSFDRNQGHQILNGLFKYYNNLNDVYEMLRSTETVEKRLGMKLYRMLAEMGGPPHINVEFDVEDLMEKFEWNERGAFNCRKLVDETDALWGKIQIEAEKLKAEYFLF